MAKGFIYVLSNPAFAGLLKIGYSSKVPEERAGELFTTGVPTPFVVEYYCLANGGIELEARVHEALSAKRHAANREFFSLGVQEASATIEVVCRPEYVWSRQPVERQRPARVPCSRCGAEYVSAIYCPKCRIKLQW